MQNSDLINGKKLLKKGKLVIFPTETVFGLGGNATNSKVIKKIYNLKKRPINNPLICHFKNLSQIKKNFYMNELELKIGKLYWPGPLTLILKKKKNSKISPKLSNHSSYVGCRIPKNKIAMELLKKLDFPIAAPSANLSNKVSATRHSDIDSDLKKNIFVVKGKSKLGLESTVIQIKENYINILRYGSITEEDIRKKIKNIKIKKPIKNKLSPGNQKKHYSPNLPLRINVRKVKKNESLLNFGKNNLYSNVYNLNLSRKGNLVEASRNFFHYLNLLDRIKSSGIAVAKIPNKGLGKTINDRLKRASFKDN